MTLRMTSSSAKASSASRNVVGILRTVPPDAITSAKLRSSGARDRANLIHGRMPATVRFAAGSGLASNRRNETRGEPDSTREWRGSSKVSNATKLSAILLSSTAVPRALKSTATTMRRVRLPYDAAGLLFRSQRECLTRSGRTVLCLSRDQRPRQSAGACGHCRFHHPQWWRRFQYVLDGVVREPVAQLPREQHGTHDGTCAAVSQHRPLSTS